MSPLNSVNFKKSAFLPVYYPLLNCRDRLIILWGGRDSGKSHFIAQKLIIECLREKYFRCILIKKTFNSIRSSQWQTIKDIVEDWGLEDLFVFNTAPLEIKCVNGNTFIARGCDSPGKIKSIKDPSHAWYEEANQLSEDDHVTIQTTLRSNKVANVQELFSLNPESDGIDYHNFWVYRKFFSKQSEYSFRDKITLEVEGDVCEMSLTVLHTTYKDNRFCTPERQIVLESLKETNPYYYEVFTRGNWGNRINENPFITTFKEASISEGATFDARKQVFLSIDFNLNPFVCILFHYFKDASGYHLHFFDEIEIEYGNIPKMCEEIRNRYGRQLTTMRITGDFMGKRRDISHKDTAHYYEQIRRLLRISNQQIKLVANPSHGKSRQDCNNLIFSMGESLKINPKCRGLIYDLRNTRCDAHGSIIKSNRSDKTQRADFIDCFRYAVNTFCQDFLRYLEKISSFTNKNNQ